MPIPFELVLIIAMLWLQQLKRRCVVRLGLHFGGQRLVDLESISIIQVHTFHKPADIFGVTPQQHAISATVPQSPVQIVFFRIPKQVAITVPYIAFIRVDACWMVWQPKLFHPELGGDPEPDTGADGASYDSRRKFFRPHIDLQIWLY